MGFFEWHERLVKKVSLRNVSFAIFGEALAFFSLGSMFSNKLVKYGYFILIAAAILTYSYAKNNFTAWHQNTKVSYSAHISGFTGAILLLLFFGIQTPQMRFKIYILGIGVILVLPALKDIIKKN